MAYILCPCAYFQDDNRYNAGRGAHLTLKRAEKARALVNKLPGMTIILTRYNVLGMVFEP